jgi:hypothetical protein
MDNRPSNSSLTKKDELLTYVVGFFLGQSQEWSEYCLLYVNFAYNFNLTFKCLKVDVCSVCNISVAPQNLYTNI